MPNFGARLRLFFRPGSAFMSRALGWRATMGATKLPDSLDCFFLHRGAALLGPFVDRRQRACRRDDAFARPHGGVSRTDSRASRFGLFRRHARRDARRAGDHPARGPYPRLRRPGRAGRGFRDPDASLCFASGMARFPRADRLRLCRALRGDRSLDQRQGGQLQSGRALCALSDRQFRRLGRRPDGAATALSERVFRIRRRRRAARAGDPAHGDDERRSPRPAPQRPSAPGLARPHGAGAANGASFALGPIFAVGIGMSPDNAPLFTSAIVVGSALGVFPVGAISDRVDRRLVMAAAMIAGAACEIALSRQTGPGVWLIALGFLVGLTTYSLYTLAVSLANDGASAHDMILISVGLLFIYCVAAIAAPAVASVLMKDFGPQALFLQNGAVHTAIAAVVLWRLVAEPGKRAGRVAV